MPVICPVIASRDRPKALRRQLGVLIDQLRERERIVVVLDGGAVGDLPTRYDPERVHFICLRRQVGVDRARRIGNAFVPDSSVILEIDDHDYASPHLLQELRTVFANRNTMLATCDVQLTDPDGKVTNERRKEPGPCRERGMQGYGMRAYRAWVYNAVGGYPLDWYPANDLALLCMMEQLTHFEGTIHIPKLLVSVTVDATGISGQLKKEQEEAVCRVCDRANNGGFKLPFRMPRKVVEDADAVRTVEPDKAPALVISGPTPTVAARSRKPHVLLVTEIVGHGRGGGEMSMLGCLRGLAEAGMRVSALYARDAGKKPYESDWLTLHKLNNASLHHKHTAASEEVTHAIRRLAPDVIVSEVRTAANIADVCEELNVPLVTLVQFWHNIIKTDDAGFEAIHERPIPREAVDVWGSARLGKSAALVANSAFTAEVIEQVFQRRAAAVVFPPVKAEAVVPKKAPEVHKRQYVTCPSVQPGKGSEIFLALARRHPEYKFLLLAGDNRHSGEDEIMKLAAKLENVTVRKDWIADMREVYRDTRCVFIGTQTCESFSRTAAEARACGIPLLVSDAGNLRHIVDAASGVIVPRKAPLADWQAALKQTLKLRPEPSLDYCTDHTRRFETAIDAHRRLSEIAFIQTPATGIKVGVSHFQDVLGCTGLDWMPSAATASQFPLVVLPGMGDPGFSEGCETRLAYWWCSHCAQMDTSRHEMEMLLNIVAEVESRADRFLLMTSAPDAELWGRVLGRRSLWLPNVLCLPERAPNPSKLEGRHVFLPGPFGVRKNVFTALAACAKIDAEAHVTELAIRDAPLLGRVAQALRTRLHIHECPTVADVQQVAGRCGAAIHVSTAETYCLGAVECVLAGTPCVWWHGIPALRNSPMELCIDDPTDIQQAADALSVALTEDHFSAQYDELRALAASMNQSARTTLREVLNA